MLYGLVSSPYAYLVLIIDGPAGCADSATKRPPFIPAWNAPCLSERRGQTAGQVDRQTDGAVALVDLHFFSFHVRLSGRVSSRSW